MAEFREYAHLQKHRSGDGEVYHLEALDQWMICRDGIYGDWFWNPDSRFTSQPAITCGESNRIGGDVLPLEDFIIRAVPRPINEIALVIFARWALVAKNWDAFIEIYGVPGGVIEMPQNVPPDKEAQYEQSAKAVAEGGVGAIPNGSKYFPNDGPRGTDPFTPRIKTLDEDLVLAGTGGKMGMLNASAGLGGGNQSKTHDEVFQEIAQSRAAAISETFQRQFDAEVLEREHPGEPALVYFDLSPSEDVDVDGLVKNVVSLSGAGWNADEGWLKEQTGYELKEKEEPEIVDPTDPGDPTDLKDDTITNRLQELSTASDEEFTAKFAAFNRDFPQVGRILNGEARVPAGSPEGGEWAGGHAKAPDRISIELADTALEKGFPVKDKDGRSIHFGQALKKHLEDDHSLEDSNGRKKKLKWAIETVRSGQRVEIPDPKTGELLAHYGKWFDDNGKNKGFLSVVSTKRDEAFTIIPAGKRHFRKRGLENRDEKMEQPILVVLKAIAAAGGPKDYLKLTHYSPEVKG